MTGTHHRIDWRIVILFWLAVSAMYVIRAVMMGASTPLISDTDDAMRLVIVRDFLGGQNWFDHTQYRLNVPFGADIHWSRFIDLPLAGLYLLFSPFMGDNAYVGVAYAWPLILLLVLLTLSASLTTYLIGKDGLLPGLVLPVLSAVVLVEFAPGRVDHHSVQIILSLLMVLATVKSWRTPGWAIVSGLAAATSLAVGLETLPVIASAILAYGLGFVLQVSNARQLRGFGLAFGLGTLVHLMLALPPSHWLDPACDAISLTWVTSALGVGAGFVLLSILPLRSLVLRLAASVVVGGALTAALVLAFPQCLAGPYAGMDPWLAEHWLSRIIEAKPVWYSFEGLPAYTAGIIIPPLVALGVLVLILKRTRGMEQAEWSTLGLFLGLGLLITLLQIRGARLVAPMLVPAAAWAIVQVRARYLKSQKVADALALLGTWLVFAGLAVALVAGWALPRGKDEVDLAADAGGNRTQCLMPDVFTDLAALPPEAIMTPVDLGAHMLLFTGHSVTGAPYHRNQEGVLDTFHFFNLPVDEARALLDERGISLVVTCPWLNEMQGFEDTPDTALVKMMARGELPDWLQDVSLPGATLKTYVVTD